MRRGSNVCFSTSGPGAARPDQRGSVAPWCGVGGEEVLGKRKAEVFLEAPQAAVLLVNATGDSSREARVPPGFS